MTTLSDTEFKALGQYREELWKEVRAKEDELDRITDILMDETARRFDEKCKREQNELQAFLNRNV
jgi:hypothetical protein